MESKVRDHYNSEKLTQKIETALINDGKDLSNLDLKDLAPVDQLHTGGAPASIKLFKHVCLSEGALVLDAGCGIGGSSRLLARTMNCRVIGVDLADRFIHAAEYLTRLTRLEDKVSFKQGTILDLPFEDNTFDAVLCQHILMNIKNKKQAFKEFFRVLKQGGQLILHEITKGEKAGVIFPVPWAGDPSISFLESWDTLSDLLLKQGFQTDVFSDETERACSLWERVKTASPKKKSGPGSLGPGIVFGENATSFGKNMFANYKNNTLCLVEAILKKGYGK